MPANRLPLLILTMSILYIFIVPDDPFVFKLFFKLIPMAMILMYAFEQSGRWKSKTHWLLLCGLIFSMLGDGTIHWFILGLSAFLIAHLFYITAFLTRWNFSVSRMLYAIPVGIYAILFGRRLIQALNESGEQSLVIPVLLYILVISVMTWSAMMTGNHWALWGSILFVISDSVLAWNMFISPIPNAAELIMLTYYAAQFLIAHSLFTIVKNSHRLVW
ncbi:lysoplasmalogenase [Virgibacillus halodenitrificans]|uniref:Lysoplasmalogenase n=1 Tax=Virgibacillus halodenitrificans TaxID=1482 RepID=A0AAC9J5Y9_VIRHA|nr:lysoplasmalogenase [Virgibacillus halodenitrificans]APC49955.1 hypothetical protein BME96_17885 [Virgibacillus halodenitrificans]MCJ0932109.1 lysoplasmalogenase [Virgibacillus halodenitrificans]MYL59024.1 lysoplasmalogenase [Virgibacillus halodenitrificans]